MQTGPTDLRHFDPTLTCIPPTLSDLVTTERSLHVDDFNYVAPEGVNPSGKSLKNSPDALFKDESVRPTSVEIVGSAEPALAPLENSTDEEKVMVRNKVGSAPAVGGVALLDEEGMFVEGTPPCVSEVLVTAEINQSWKTHKTNNIRTQW